jgi:hypothetical protein
MLVVVIINSTVFVPTFGLGPIMFGRYAVADFHRSIDDHRTTPPGDHVALVRLPICFSDYSFGDAALDRQGTDSVV